MSQTAVSRFLRLPEAVKRGPWSRSGLYRLAPEYPGLMRKMGKATIVDTVLADEIAASLPPARIAPPRAA